MKVTYVDHMGSDLSVVNAARVSFNKKSDWQRNEEGDRMGYGYDLRLLESDAKLINYLAKHGHTSPFNHTFITLHVKAPIFVARQLVKHKFMPWNEVSRRYVDDEPEFFEPDKWRKRAENVKQGSSDESVLVLRTLGFQVQTVDEAHERFNNHSIDLYNDMLEAGIAPEQARMVLPQSTYTEWYWSGTLGAWSDMYKLRIDAHAQKETQEVARQAGEIISGLFPVSWKALTQ